MEGRREKGEGRGESGRGEEREGEIQGRGRWERGGGASGQAGQCPPLAKRRPGDKSHDHLSPGPPAPLPNVTVINRVVKRRRRAAGGRTGEEEEEVATRKAGRLSSRRP